MSAVVELRDATVDFPGAGKRDSVTAVDRVSLDIEAASIVGVIGYSGAGKSTLVRLLNGLEKPTRGSVTVLGVDVGGADESQLRALRSRVGMVFQQFNLFSSRTVRGNVAYPLRVAGWTKEAIAARVDELLAFVGLTAHAGRHPRRLSGGQKQRVGIARALATNPDLLLADEATSALDPATTAEVLDLLREINRRMGITIVVITHEIQVVHELCDRVVVMDAGRVVDSGDTYEVFARPRAALTRRFVAAVTQGVPVGDTLEALRAGGGELVSVEVNEFTSEDVEAILQDEEVRGSVVYGGVTDVRGRQLGTLTYRLRTDPGTADRIAHRLGERTRVSRLPAVGMA